MKHWINVIGLLGLCLVGWTGCKKATTRQPRGRAAVKPLKLDKHADAVKTNNAFTLALYAQLAKKRVGQNVFLSPYSIATALHMTMAGANGATASEMEKALFVHLPKAKRHKALAGLMAQLMKQAKRGDYQLTIANRLWGQTGYAVEAPFQALMRNVYDAPFAALDFKTNSQSARNTINAWAAKQTNDKIKGLLPPGSLSPLTRLVLTNAIYFKGSWASRFQKSETRESAFIRKPTGKRLTKQTVNVQMMHQKAKFRHGYPNGHRIIALPYQNKSLSMLVILPKPKTSTLVDVAASLTPALLAKWESKMFPSKLDVFLPRFRMTTALSLNEPLKQMGIKQAFVRGKADLTGISKKHGKDLHISTVVHKAFIDVNEEGTEAAAATAAVAATKSASLSFRADRPFLIVIKDNHTGAILFIGHVYDPTTA